MLGSPNKKARGLLPPATPPPTTPLCQHYLIVCKKYCHKSYKTTRESFKEKFGDEQTLPNSTIKRIVERFQVHFCLEDVLCSRRPMMQIGEKRKEMRQQIVATPHVSVCKLTQHIPILSCISTYCTLKDLCLHPYHVQMRRVKTNKQIWQNE